MPDLLGYHHLPRLLDMFVQFHQTVAVLRQRLQNYVISKECVLVQAHYNIACG